MQINKCLYITAGAMALLLCADNLIAASTKQQIKNWNGEQSSVSLTCNRDSSTGEVSGSCKFKTKTGTECLNFPIEICTSTVTESAWQTGTCGWNGYKLTCN